MKQIPFSYYKDFVPGLSEDEMIKRYAVTGGVPKYAKAFEDILKQQFMYNRDRLRIAHTGCKLFS